MQEHQSTSATAPSTIKPAQNSRKPGADEKALASVLAGNPAPPTSGQAKPKALTPQPAPAGKYACPDGKLVPEHHAEQCGASNITIRYGTFSGGAVPPASFGTGPASIHDNVINGASATPSNKLEVKDPGTTFTHNTVKNMDTAISNGARADSNLLEGKGGSENSNKQEGATPSVTLQNSPGSAVSVNQTGGVNAGTIYNYVPPQRTLSPDDEASLTSALSRHPGKVTVGACGTDSTSEPHKFALKIQRIFRAAGWTLVEPDIAPMYTSQPYTGVMIEAKGKRGEPLPASATYATRALQGAHIKPIRGIPHPEWTDETFVLVVVGENPDN
jgi:hypothetical protein